MRKIRFEGSDNYYKCPRRQIYDLIAQGKKFRTVFATPKFVIIELL